MAERPADSQHGSPSGGRRDDAASAGSDRDPREHPSESGQDAATEPRHEQEERGAGGRLVGAWADILLAVGLLAVAAGMVWMADDFGPEARRLPFVVGIPLIGLAAVNLTLVATRAVRGPLPAAGGATGAKASKPAEGESSAPSTRHELEEAAAQAEGDESDGLALHWTLLSLAVVVAMFYFLGLVVTAFVYTTGFMRLVGKQPWKKVVPMVVVLMLLLYVFAEVLGVSIYDGWLFDEGLLPDVVPF